MEEAAYKMMVEEEAQDSELEETAWETSLLGWWSSNNNGLQLHREECYRAAEAWAAYCERLQQGQEDSEGDAEGEDTSRAKEQLRGHLEQEDALRLKKLVDGEREAAEYALRKREMEAHDRHKEEYYAEYETQLVMWERDNALAHGRASQTCEPA